MVQLGNYDLMILMDTKILDAVYWKNRLGYDVVCSRAANTAAGGDQVGVGLFMMESLEG